MTTPPDEEFWPEVGQWVRWVTPEIQREGQIIVADWPSLIIQWLGVETPQVFPWGMNHFGYKGSRIDMEIIEKPARAAQIERQTRSGVMGIAAAAAALGSTPKAVRAKLRAGKLQGIQRDGRWVEVILE